MESLAGKGIGMLSKSLVDSSVKLMGTEDKGPRSMHSYDGPRNETVDVQFTPHGEDHETRSPLTRVWYASRPIPIDRCEFVKFVAGMSEIANTGTVIFIMVAFSLVQ